MRIERATLGMDATLTHKDVQGATGRLTQSESGWQDLQFQLNVQDISRHTAQQAGRFETSRVEAVSTVVGAPGRTDHATRVEQSVGRIITEIINVPVQVREVSMAASRGDGNAADLTSPGWVRGAGQVSLTLRQLTCNEERLQVSAVGMVETMDGRTIDLGLELEISRLEYRLEQRLGDGISARFIDPLVLSFTDGLSVLGSTRFQFDLDCDGVADEEIASLASGSGFLVLDRNGDGLVNDGGELFGPVTGCGYSELQLFDVDGNTWIDENDPVFDQLRLWMGAGSGEERLVTLREAGVGALALAAVDGGFTLKGSDGRVLGEVRSSGLFLTEQGEVRPMAEIDLAVSEEEPPFGWRSYSNELQRSLARLREMIMTERRRLAREVMALRAERRDRHREMLLERLFALRRE